MKTRNCIIILGIALFVSSACDGGVISPGGGPYPINSTSGKIFIYIPSVSHIKGGANEDPASAGEWSLTCDAKNGVLYIASKATNECTVKTEASKLDPNWIDNNSGNLSCRGTSVGLQAIR